jgi:hypothetical protein
MLEKDFPFPENLSGFHPASVGIMILTHLPLNCAQDPERNGTPVVIIIV